MLAMAVPLVACSGTATDESGATPSEARQLNESAAALDNQAAFADPADANVDAGPTDSASSQEP